MISNAKTFERDLIDQEVARLQASIRAQFSRRNTLSAVFVLPTELLSRVFVACQDLNICDDFAAPRGWIQVSHVCRHWRSVALECHSLWKYVPTVCTSSCQEETLKRSKNVPLSFRYRHPWNNETNTNLQTALKYMDRVEDLRLFATPRAMRNIVNQFSSKVPLLRSVFLHQPGDFPSSGEALKAFYDNPPILNRLSLVGCFFQWKSSIYHGLTHLNISNISSDNYIPFSDLLVILQHSPNMQTLRLWDAYSSDSEHFPTSDGVLALPFLTRLEICCSLQAFVALSNRIDAPSITYLKIECKVGSGGPELSSFSAILARVCKQIEFNGQILRSLHLRESYHRLDECSVDARGWTFIQPAETVLDHSTAFLHITLQCGLVDNDLPPAISKDFCEAIPVSHIEHLSLTGLGGKGLGNVWTKKFGNLSSLKTIDLNGVEESGVSTMLMASVKTLDCKDRDAQDVLFEGLKTVTFRYTKFKEVDSPGSLYGCLKSFLRVRRKRGMILAALKLFSCSGLWDEQVESLEKYVGELDCIDMRDPDEESSEYDEYDSGEISDDFTGYGSGPLDTFLFDVDW